MRAVFVGQVDDASFVVHWVRCPEPSTWCSPVRPELSVDRCKFDTAAFESLFRKRDRITKPGVVGNYRLAIEELPIKGACEAVGVRLFFVKYLPASEDTWFDVGLFIMNEWQLMDVGPNASITPFSGMVAGDAAYLSYGWGSGVFRSVLARLRVVDGAIQTLSTGGFFSRYLFVRAVGVRVGVFSGVPERTFNAWQREEPFGFLQVSRGGGLEVVDGNGQPITPGY